MVEPSNQFNFNAWINSKTKWLKVLEPGTKTTIEIFLLSLDSNTAQNIWVRFADTTLDPPSETTKHFGWKIIDADLFASNADGITQKITDTGINLESGPQKTRLRAVVNPGIDIKFYVNDVLKVTHTVNLPDENHYYFHTQVRVTAPTFRTTYLGRILIEKEYAV
ncbi:unnamed protein product [marine sediment metagenome]|uniref:Uncharacterized protein n=1 Tax=marine sediment metagenome TaxID=412755 RepID=X1PTH2_9ZZZZ